MTTNREEYSAGTADATGKTEIEMAELAELQPSRNEQRWFHVIALSYVILAVVVGLPLWWYTTSPEQHTLPMEGIQAAARHAITVGVDVVVLDLSSSADEDEVETLRQLLYVTAADAQHNLDARHQTAMQSDGGLLASTDAESRLHAALPVRVDYRFYVAASAVPPEVKQLAMTRGVSTELDLVLIHSSLLNETGGAVQHSVGNAYYFVILPPEARGFESGKAAAIVRASPERNLIYIRSTSVDGEPVPVEQLSSVIMGLLQEHLVMPSTLQLMYTSVWWKSDSGTLAKAGRDVDAYTAARAEVERQRTHQLPASPGYEVTVSLVSAFDGDENGLPRTDDWLEGGLSLGEWLGRKVEPGLANLKQFINLRIYSQYLYSVTLDGLLWSRLSKDRTHRYYTAPQLSSVLNSLEAYLGQHTSERSQMDARSSNSGASHGGLHFVVVLDAAKNASVRRPLRFHLAHGGESSASSIALVPQWGAFISLDDVDVSLSNLESVLINAVRSFVGLSVAPRTVVELTESKLVAMKEGGGNAKWELDLWLRHRAIESLATATLTLTSLVSTAERVPTMVINEEVAGRVTHAVTACARSVAALAAPPSSAAVVGNAGPRAAFEAAREALENSDAAFFDHSLLDLLYFPSDQVYGIYVPLFAPIGLPLLASGLTALKFFLKKDVNFVKKDK